MSFHTRWALFVLAALTAPTMLAAQRSVTATATLSIEGLGRVTAATPLRRGGEERSRGLWVTGTVATMHVGPYVLQVRLTDQQADSVLVRDPITNTLARLTVGEWVTVASGPGGKNVLNPVAFLIVGGSRDSDVSQDPERLAVSYRLLP